MNKIASPNDLIAEINRLLAYCSGPSPSRTRLASELMSLAQRLGGATSSARYSVDDEGSFTLAEMIEANDWTTSSKEVRELKALKVGEAVLFGLDSVKREK